MLSPGRGGPISKAILSLQKYWDSVAEEFFFEKEALSFGASKLVRSCEQRRDELKNLDLKSLWGKTLCYLDQVYEDGRWKRTTNHKQIGSMYFFLGVWCGLRGFSLSLLIRANNA